MRIYSASLAILISACSADPVAKNGALMGGTANKVDCAMDGAERFAALCAIERGQGRILTLRHADGGFRKFTLEDNGAVEPADGAETVSVRLLNDGRAEIMIAEDRYRLPVMP